MLAGFGRKTGNCAGDFWLGGQCASEAVRGWRASRTWPLGILQTSRNIIAGRHVSWKVAEVNRRVLIVHKVASLPHPERQRPIIHAVKKASAQKRVGIQTYTLQTKQLKLYHEPYSIPRIPRGTHVRPMRRPQHIPPHRHTLHHALKHAIPRPGRNPRVHFLPHVHLAAHCAELPVESVFICAVMNGI